MSLDMYAFTIAPSSSIASDKDILAYRVPTIGKGLPTGPVAHGCPPEFQELIRSMVSLPANVIFADGPMDLGAEFIDSKFVLPGSTLLHRWCKHPDLHGWMRRRWNVLRAGKLRKEFDCSQRVPLNVQDLDALEHAIKHRQLPKTHGPFFGISDGSETPDDLDFVSNARHALAQGQLVYYTSWW